MSEVKPGIAGGLMVRAAVVMAGAAVVGLREPL
jgi:hypothetical protein